MIEEHNLKPCPFCGHKPNIMSTYNMGFLDIWYQCVMCGSNGPKVSADLSTDEKSIDNIKQCICLAEYNWNRRY